MVSGADPSNGRCTSRRAFVLPRASSLGERSAGWWLGLPTLEPARYAWSTDDARAMLGDDPSIRRPASPPELEDFFEFSMKVKRTAAAGDGFGYASGLSAAELAPRLLLPLNPRCS